MRETSGATGTLRAGSRELRLDGGPLLMGIVNATPDSFSDAGRYRTLQSQVTRALKLVDDGADLLDIGGQSASPTTPEISAAEEIGRVVPLIEAVLAQRDTAISIDTYKLPVARAAIRAGAEVVNDISGLRDPDLARLCADTGAALVIMHNRGIPKHRLLDPDLYEDVTADVVGFLKERVRVAEHEGVERERLIVDPGPDFSKTPAQTIQLLRDLPALHELDLPILLPISRKDFIGALTSRLPSERLAGTLAALDHCVRLGGHIFRVHDVAEARAFIDVRSRLSRTN